MPAAFLDLCTLNPCTSSRVYRGIRAQGEGSVIPRFGHCVTVATSALMRSRSSIFNIVSPPDPRLSRTHGAREDSQRQLHVAN